MFASSAPGNTYLLSQALFNVEMICGHTVTRYLMHEYKCDFLTVLTEHSLIKLIKKPNISKISEDPQTDIDRESAYFYYNGILTNYTH